MAFNTVLRSSGWPRSMEWKWTTFNFMCICFRARWSRIAMARCMPSLLQHWSYKYRPVNHDLKTKDQAIENEYEYFKKGLQQCTEPWERTRLSTTLPPFKEEFEKKNGPKKLHTLKSLLSSGFEHTVFRSLGWPRRLLAFASVLADQQ